MSIVDYIKNQAGFVSMQGATKEQVAEAEDALKVKFAKDYKEYVLNMGAAAFVGHELTGICNSPRLNVVNVTTRVKEVNETVEPNLYVLEETHVDGIIIWQSASGNIYKTSPNIKAVKIADSIIAYLNDN